MKKYYVASCSFGKDSLCMVLKLLELKYCLDEIIYLKNKIDKVYLILIKQKRSMNTNEFLHL